MRVLAGLGNPGSQYQGTRHNLGFAVVDQIATQLGLKWEKGHDGLLAIGRSAAGEKFFLFKPGQYMNSSGQPLRSLLDYYDIPTSEVAIVADDVYVAPGSGRIRKSGGDGGHNGWKSVIAHLEPDVFWRIKIGCGVYEQHPEKRMAQPALDAYVLEKQPKTEQKRTDELIDKIRPNLVEWLESGSGLLDQTVHI